MTDVGTSPQVNTGLFIGGHARESAETPTHRS
jgi:hypothetical protein